MMGGALLPYELDYVPGAWMRSISVSKGTSSVKQGYESITGQIDVEYLKPDEDQGLLLNVYGNSRGMAESNLTGNIHLNKYLSTEILGHWNEDFMHHDEDGDGWHDMPAVNQWHVQNRWKYRRGRYMMHAGVGLLKGERMGGQMDNAGGPIALLRYRDNEKGERLTMSRYRAEVSTLRTEGYMKHAWLLDREHNTNVAFTTTVGTSQADALFGYVDCGFGENSLVSQLLLEHDFSEAHSLSTGMSFTFRELDDSLNCEWGNLMFKSLNCEALSINERETVPGAYVQYTFKPSYRFTLMAGLRADLYGYGFQDSSFRFQGSRIEESGHRLQFTGERREERGESWLVTPRVHVKWMVSDWVTLRGAMGKGYRPVHALAENHYLMASGRTLKVSQALVPEEAWNEGVSAAFYVPVGNRTMTVNAEYYYTDFLHQAVVDYDSDPMAISIADLAGRSYSHTVQVDATYAPTDEWEVMCAFRYNDVKCTYGGELKEKPLQSRYKGLVTVSWEPMMALWHVDVTLQLNGPGRMPTPYKQEDGTLSWDETFPAYPQLNMQLTRDFRHLSVYIGGENLTNYRQPMAVIGADNPWATTFEPTMVWGPVTGVMAYAGVRLNFWRMR